MKILRRRLAKLYPRWWRERYGREFQTLLEDADLKWRDLIDVIVSAVEMKMEAAPQPRIVSLASRDIPGGYELESAVEFPRAGGEIMLVRNFCREIDLGDSYLMLNHCSRGDQPAQTVAHSRRDPPPDSRRRRRAKRNLIALDMLPIALVLIADILHERVVAR